MSLLTLRHLSKRYGPTLAVADVDLDVPAGSRTAIVGPSGSGKTTLLRLIAGFEQPDEGEITLGETVLANGTTAIPAHARGIGYVAQEGALFPHLSVAANIGFGIGRNSADHKHRIAAMMDAVGLPLTMLERRPHELSGGQQQRVALARALARQPKLMLLDEPFSALDAGLRESTRDMVSAVLSAAGVTAILVTHDQAEALSFADHLAVMRDGAVVQAGTPQQLYLQPRDAQTAVFLGEAIILDADLADGWGQSDLGRCAVDGAGKRGSARIMLRPEQIQIVPIGAKPLPGSDASAANGRIVSRSFRGPTCRVVVEPLSGKVGQSCVTLVTSSLIASEVGDLVRLDITGAAHVFE
jgi:iron(III) transport system ATP-binding protein